MMRCLPDSSAVELNGTHSPAAGVAAIVTTPVTDGQMWIADAMYCGFDTTPANGTVIVSVAISGTVFKVYLPRAEPRVFRFPRGLYKTVSRDGAILANCSGGGAGPAGTTNMTYR
jgi:hypothetical protein